VAAEEKSEAVTNPRYDDVFVEGTKWIDSLSGGDARADRDNLKVLESCEDCHMFATGALECSQEYICERITFLEKKLSEWSEPVGELSAEYDPIVKKLTECALKQAKRTLAHGIIMAKGTTP